METGNSSINAKEGRGRGLSVPQISSMGAQLLPGSNSVFLTQKKRSQAPVHAHLHGPNFRWMTSISIVVLVLWA